VGSGGAPAFLEPGTWAVVGPLLFWSWARGQWWGPCFLGARHVGSGGAPAFLDLGTWAVVGPLLSWSRARGRGEGHARLWGVQGVPLFEGSGMVGEGQ